MGLSFGLGLGVVIFVLCSRSCGEVYVDYGKYGGCIVNFGDLVIIEWWGLFTGWGTFF